MHQIGKLGSHAVSILSKKPCPATVTKCTPWVHINSDTRIFNIATTGNFILNTMHFTITIITVILIFINIFVIIISKTA
jgi:hypothetical protein